jgi:hypothetical protein
VQQIVIDPTKHGSPTETAPVNILPPEVRKFGYVPDLRACKSGDLILSSSIEPGFMDRQIMAVQDQLGLAREHTRWTHAAIFLYEDWIVEATPREGVITRSLYPDIPDALFRVRRWPHLTEEERYKIALCAQRMLGARYDKKVAFFAGLKARFGEWCRHDWFPVTRPTILCSKVFYDAHVEVTRTLLKDCPLNDLVTPAHLSATGDLKDIAVPWLKVPP